MYIYLYISFIFYVVVALLDILDIPPPPQKKKKNKKLFITFLEYLCAERSPPE